jgi:hypothetical protein
MATIKIKHVYGNPLSIAIPLDKIVHSIIDGHEVETRSEFYPNPNYDVLVILKGIGLIRYEYVANVNGNVVSIKDSGEIRVGKYSVEVVAYDENEERRRYKVNSIIEIVDATIDAGIDKDIEFNIQEYILDGAVYLYAKGDKGDKGDKGYTGVGIQSVEQIQTSDVSGGTNIVRVTLTNGETSDFEVKNGRTTITVEGETLKIK